jgi:hypothetical protein
MVYGTSFERRLGGSLVMYLGDLPLIRVLKLGVGIKTALLQSIFIVLEGSNPGGLTLTDYLLMTNFHCGLPFGFKISVHEKVARGPAGTDQTRGRTLLLVICASLSQP